MKKVVMKILVACLLFATALCCFTACSGGGEVTLDKLTGTWKFSKMHTDFDGYNQTINVGDYVEGYSFTQDSMVIEIKKNGSVKASWMGRIQNGSWKQEDGYKEISTDIGFILSEGKWVCNGNTLVITESNGGGSFGGGGSYTWTLVKTADAPENDSTPPTELGGSWKFVSYQTKMNDVDQGTLGVGTPWLVPGATGSTLSEDSFVLLLKADGTFELHNNAMREQLGEYYIFEGTWSKTDDVVEVDYHGKTVVVTFNNGNMTWNFITGEGSQYKSESIYTFFKFSNDVINGDGTGSGDSGNDGGSTGGSTGGDTDGDRGDGSSSGNGGNSGESGALTNDLIAGTYKFYFLKSDGTSYGVGDEYNGDTITEDSHTITLYTDGTVEYTDLVNGTEQYEASFEILSNQNGMIVFNLTILGETYTGSVVGEVLSVGVETNGVFSSWMFTRPIKK